MKTECFFIEWRSSLAQIFKTSSAHKMSSHDEDVARKTRHWWRCALGLTKVSRDKRWDDSRTIMKPVGPWGSGEYVEDVDATFRYNEAAWSARPKPKISLRD